VPIINSISNTSSGNNLTTTVNGVAAAAVSIINSNTTSLSGTNLTTTVNGVASTALDLSPIVTSKAWSLTGNSGTIPGTNFIGTTDDKDLVLKRNNVASLTIEEYQISTPKSITSKGLFAYVTAQSSTDSNKYVSLGYDGSVSSYSGHITFSKSLCQAIIKADNVSDNRTLQLPDASGTLALTSDIGGGYKSYVAIVNFSSGGFTQTILKNDFSGITFTWSNPSTSVLRITPSTAVTFTNDKTVAFVNSYENEYFVTPKRANNPALDYVNLSHTKYDGTTNTMVYGKFYIEIRVYP
jgi:hypothetical protein